MGVMLSWSRNECSSQIDINNIYPKSIQNFPSTKLAWVGSKWIPGIDIDVNIDIKVNEDKRKKK